MKPYNIKIVLLVVISCLFLAGSLVSYINVPSEASLWVSLGLFGSISLLFSLLLLIRFYISSQESNVEVEMDISSPDDKK